MPLSSVLAKLVPGFGVASGKCGDARFPSGTIAMQLPYFEQFGLKLKGYYQGTLNLDISPYDFELLNPDYSFNSVRWSTDLPAENFSFFSCRLKRRMLIPILVIMVLCTGRIHQPSPNFIKT